MGIFNISCFTSDRVAAAKIPFSAQHNFVNLCDFFSPLSSSQDLSSTQDAERERVFLVCQIIRVGRMHLKDVESKKQARGMRRPFGVAAIELTELFRGGADSDEEKQSFIPFLQ